EGLHPLGRFLRSDAEPVPPLSDVRDPLQRRVALAAEVDRRMRLLDRLGILPARRKTIELAGIARHRIAPQALHHFEVGARALRATLEGHLEGAEFLLEPTDADAEVHASARQIV